MDDRLAVAVIKVGQDALPEFGFGSDPASSATPHSPLPCWVGCFSGNAKGRAPGLDPIGTKIIFDLARIGMIDDED